MENKCITCNNVIPEGRQVCPTCEKKCLMCGKRSAGEFCIEHQEMFDKWTGWAKANYDKIGSEQYESPFVMKEPNYGDLSGAAKVVSGLLKQGNWTKAELAKALTATNIIKDPTDRTIREIVSIVAKKEPVISLSSRPGYYIATKPEHSEDVIKAWKEIDCRIRELALRRMALIEFRENAERKQDNGHV